MAVCLKNRFLIIAFISVYANILLSPMSDDNSFLEKTNAISYVSYVAAILSHAIYLIAAWCMGHTEKCHPGWYSIIVTEINTQYIGMAFWRGGRLNGTANFHSFHLCDVRACVLKRH